MCYAVYIGSDQPLQVGGWNKDTREVYLTSLTKRDEVVKKWFSKPFIYYAGAHTQCGCGFFHNRLTFTDDAAMMKEYEESQTSARALVAIVELAMKTQGSVEVFVTWEGRQGEPPQRRLTMSPDKLLSPLEPYGEDEEVRIANCSIEEQDFVVMEKESHK